MKRAFTIVELLVVIAVLALLMALLMPALRGAREHARNARCLSNLRQLALAYDAYRSSHKLQHPGGWEDMDIEPLFCPSDPGGTCYILMDWDINPARPILQTAQEAMPAQRQIIGSDCFTFRHGLGAGEALSANPNSAQWLRTWRNKAMLDGHAQAMRGPSSTLMDLIEGR